MAEKKINGATYRVTPIPASEALELLAEIIRISGPLAPRLPIILAGLTDAEAEGRAFADASFLEALAGTVNFLGASGVRDLVKRIVEVAQIQRPSGYSQVDLDGDFTGNLGAVIPVAKFVLKETYGDFFPASGGNGLLGMLAGSLKIR